MFLLKSVWMPSHHQALLMWCWWGFLCVFFFFFAELGHRWGKLQNSEIAEFSSTCHSSLEVLEDRKQIQFLQLKQNMLRPQCYLPWFILSGVQNSYERIKCFLRLYQLFSLWINVLITQINPETSENVEKFSEVTSEHESKPQSCTFC